MFVIGTRPRRWAIAALLALACGPKLKPGLKVTGAQLEAKFDRAMVASEALGREVKDAPLRVTPPVPGKLRWLDARTLAFTPDQPLPGSTRFELEVKAGTVALDGHGIDKPVRWSFETERLAVDFPGPPGKWATPDQAIAVAFNQPVKAREVEKRCAYASDIGKVAAVVDSTGEAEEARRRFRVIPNAPLALATSWRFSCARSLAGTEGPLSIEPGATNEITFETYGPFKVTEVSPRGQQVSPDEAAIVIRLSNPMPAAAGALPIRLEPAVEGFPERAVVSGDRISMSLRSLLPNTVYTIKIDGALADRFGQRLGGEHVSGFGTGDGTPRLDVETGAWVVEANRGGYLGWTRNLTKLEADVAVVPEAKLEALVSELDWWDDRAVDLPKLGLRGVHKTIPIQGRQNHWHQIAIEPAKLLGAAAPATGFYYVALRAPEEPRQGSAALAEPPAHELLLNLTNLGVTAKFAGPSGLVWVTRLDDGQPQAGADVTIRDRAGKVRWRGKTGADGVAVTPGTAQLAPKSARLVAQADGELAGDGEGGEEMEHDGRQRAELLVFARVGADVTWVNPLRNGGLAAWNFHVPIDESPRAVQLRGFLHTDRGLYRPGETVHLRGLARTMKLGGALRVPGGRKVRVTVRDPRGEEILAKNVAMSRYGGFALDVPLGEGARLGDHRVEAALAEGSFSERFSVEQYRAAAFEVKIPAPAREPVAGEDVKLTAEARYLYGAPVRGGAIIWRVYRRGRAVSFAKLPQFEFGDARSLYDDWHSRSAVSEPLVNEEAKRLDKDGRAKLSLRLAKQDFQSAQDLMVTAEVQDETHQTIAANVAIPAHRAGIYFGIDRGSPIAGAGAARAVKVIAVDPKGERVAASATFRAVKRDWSCAWESWGYRGSYRCDKKEPEVTRRTITLAATGPTEIPFSPPSPGHYYLVVEGKDAAGNDSVTAAELWSYGEGEAAWQADAGQTFDIVADKPRYRVGDTARLLLKTTVGDAAGLLTIERDGVIERRTIAVGKGTSTVEVPIKEGYGPNVYVSVMLVKGRTGKGTPGMPLLRMGMTTLAVDTEGKRLEVAIATDRESYRPGDPVIAEVRVTDAAGKPVQTEVALAAADEGVLTLIAFKTPDPLATFFAPWGLGVVTATQYERLARLPEPGEERYATGGDGAPGTFRSRFMSTAYWNPAIETNANGYAKVTFAAPDNLTAYRLMAVAADAGDRFGSGERRVTVRKPLQLLSAMPRFLNVGDEAKGGVLVVNDTGWPGTVIVDASVTGARLQKSAHQEIAIPSGGRVPVYFPVRAERSGELRLRVKASLGAERDGLEIKLPVQYPAPVETQVVAQGSTKGEAALPVALPTGILPGTASLEVSVDPDGVAGLEESLRDLIEYPYGCLEQTTSRLVPLIAVEELAKSLKLASLDGPRLRTFIKAGLGKLERFQTEDGGYSLWMGGHPEPFLTAFALWGLKQARDAGHPVPQRMFDGGVAWLRGALARDEKVAGPIDDILGEMGSRAFAVHVLAELQRPEPGYAAKLLESKDKLPRFGTAFLARALAHSLGRDHAQVTGLLDELSRAIEIKGALALVREPPGRDLGYYMSSDVRTTAIATDAFLDLRPEEPALPKLIKGLFGERRDGRWSTTQGNLFALVSLVNFVKSRDGGGVSAEARLGDKTLLSGELNGKKVRIRRASVAVDAVHPAKAPLTIAAKGGEVFYSSLLRFRRSLADQKAYANRISVRREYLDAETGAAIDPEKGIKVGGMLRVQVTVSPEAWAKHLAVDDPIPAGLEVLNTKLATSGGPRKPTGDDRRWRRGEPRDIDEGWWRPAAREVRDDRVLVFVEGMPPGAATFSYLARATTAGKFVVPGISAGEMYEPEVTARTAPLTFVVREK
jgi:alpha-2-macroglobulin